MLRRYIYPVSAIVLLLVVSASVCRAHGTTCRLFEGTAAVEASYDDGRPMAFCDVAVYFPAGEEEAYRTGETDRNGRFSFIPESDGEFRIVVDDGMGHAASLGFSVVKGIASVKGPEKEDLSDGGTETGTCIFKRLGRSAGIVVGISVIFGLFGLVSLLRLSGLTGRKKGL